MNENKSIVDTGDILTRNFKFYEVIIADENVFVICRMKYSRKQDCMITSYRKPEVYANQSKINTLEELKFRLVRKKRWGYNE